MNYKKLAYLFAVVALLAVAKSHDLAAESTTKAGR